MRTSDSRSETDIARKSAELSRLLSEFPAPKTVLEYLVIERWSRWGARAACIAVPEEAGVFRLEAAFGGFTTRAFESNPPRLWGDNPFAQALVSAEGFTAPIAASDPVRDLIDGAQCSAIAVQPVRPTNQDRFVLAAACADSEDNAEACLADIRADVPLLGLFFSFVHARRAIAADRHSSLELTDAAQTLTPRQSTVLRLMSESMKNREIAFAIGFSESTVPPPPPRTLGSERE